MHPLALGQSDLSEILTARVGALPCLQVDVWALLDLLLLTQQWVSDNHRSNRISLL